MEIILGYYNSYHGFLRDESDKDCYCLGGCSMEEITLENYKLLPEPYRTQASQYI